MSVRKIDTGYKAEVFLGLDPKTNKKIRKTKTFAKQKDAKDWEREILQAYKTGPISSWPRFCGSHFKYLYAS